MLYLIASGTPEFNVGNGFAANGSASTHRVGYSMLAALLNEVVEVVMTAFFLMIILGATDKGAPPVLPRSRSASR